MPDMYEIVDAGFDTVLLALPRHTGTADVTTLPPIADQLQRRPQERVGVFSLQSRELGGTK